MAANLENAFRRTRTKLTQRAAPSRITCPECRTHLDAIAEWVPALEADRWRRIVGRIGRPRVELGRFSWYMQLVYRLVLWLTHVRRYARRAHQAPNLEGALAHFRANGMAELVTTIELVGRQLLRGDAAWGQGNEISARRFVEEVRWQAARQVVGDRLRIRSRTLRRRVVETDYFGEKLRARNASAYR